MDEDDDGKFVLCIPTASEDGVRSTTDLTSRATSSIYRVRDLVSNYQRVHWLTLVETGDSHSNATYKSSALWDLSKTPNVNEEQSFKNDFSLKLQSKQTRQIRRSVFIHTSLMKTQARMSDSPHDMMEFDHTMNPYKTKNDDGSALSRQLNSNNTETTSEESDGCDVFNIGQDEFKWVPFPKELPGSPLYQNSGNMQDCHAANNQTESLQDDLGITSAKDLESECSVYQLKSKLSVVKQEIHPPKEISSQNLRRQISGNQALSKMDSTKMFEYDRIQNKSQDLYLKVDTQVQKTENTDIVMKDLEEEDNWGDSEVKETDQSAPRAAENVDLLENCPMCLKQFSKGLSQLDIDSHLAQCLSEATVDVIW
ncbi:Fanconi anemia core complex-associated 20 [Pelobates cultripes]|uniref:Fanconi anemia core complex-associated 20 n=1 Tax=Pelobates cultripes TaxID=61616 RepID=A0AAD1T657_PELCU|nr:Fanconi anemia core complex-associated 20 [Pelobates cultripes]